ncbi:hypothetical protein, partial [Photorhabdus aegyptia]|uniref:hypothetical protein n=1 Tax=Photorhabdus aegyptia TaxID=2805098 RepID=UPI001F304C04
MQNQVKIKAAIDQKNHAPDMTTGKENMPAPIIVPPMIMAPPNKDGDDFSIDEVTICVTLAWLYTRYLSSCLFVGC